MNTKSWNKLLEKKSSRQPQGSKYYLSVTENVAFCSLIEHVETQYLFTDGIYLTDTPLPV